MAQWMIWSILAAVLVILELFSGTFYLLMVAVGLAAGAFAALGGLTVEVQIIITAAVGVVTTSFLHRSKFGKFTRTDAARDPNINIDIGQSLQIDGWNAGPGDGSTARAMYRGAQWDVDLAPHAQAVPGTFTIREIRGSRLVVTNHH